MEAETEGTEDFLFSSVSVSASVELTLLTSP